MIKRKRGLLPKNRFISVLGNRKGNMYPLTICIVIVMMLLILVASEYMKMMIICSGVEDAFEEAVISVVNDNYNEVYHCVREGYAAGYEPNGDSSFYTSVNAGDVNKRLKNLLGLKADGDSLVKINNGSEKEYTISGVKATVHNASLKNNSGKFYADGKLKLGLPMRFNGKILGWVYVNIRVKAIMREIF